MDFILGDWIVDDYQEDAHTEMERNFVRLSNEDRELIGGLYNEYFESLCRFAYRECKCTLAAEDIVQETFYYAMKEEGIRKLKETGNMAGWLYRVLQYKLMAYRRRMLIREATDIEVCGELPAVEEKYGVMELEMVLDKIFTPHEWMLFRMYYGEGRSAREMAEVEGITETNFKVRMHRLRKKVIEELGGCLD